jgi:hypothetical protein
MKTEHYMLDKPIDDEPVRACACACVCVLRILITIDKVLPFSNYNVRIYNLLKNSRHTGCGTLV